MALLGMQIDEAQAASARLMSIPRAVEGLIALITAAETLSEISTGVTGSVASIASGCRSSASAIDRARAELTGFELPLRTGADRRLDRFRIGPVDPASQAVLTDDELRRAVISGLSSGGPVGYASWLDRSQGLDAVAREINSTRLPPPLIRLQRGMVMSDSRYWTAWALRDIGPRSKVAALNNAAQASRGIANSWRAVGRAATVIGGALIIFDAYEDGQVEWTASNGNSGSTSYAVVRSVLGDVIDTAIAGAAGAACGVKGGPVGAALCAGAVAHKTDGSGEKMIDSIETMATETDDGVAATVDRLNIDDVSDQRGLGQRIIDLVDVRPGR